MISSCKVIRTILLATGVMLYACPALAGAWTQGAGRSYFKLNEEIVRANRYYEPTGNRVNIPTKGAWTTSLYVEYGLTRRVTVFGYFPFVKHITVNRQIGATSGFVFFPGDKKTGIGDIDAGVRIGLRTGGPVVVSLQISIGLPTGDSRHRNGLFTGDGEFNQQIMLQAGRSLHPFYISMEAGLNHRTGVYSEEFRYGFELGCAVHPRLTVAGRLGGVETLRNGDVTFMGATGGLGGNNQRYLTFGPEIHVMYSSSMGIAAAVYTAARGQNVLSAPAFSLGFFIRR